MKKLVLIVLSFVLCVSMIYAGAGTVSAQFLKLASGGRSSALGNAFTGITGEAMSVFYNPSGIAFSDKKQVALMYSTYLEELNYQNAAFSMPINSKSGIGLGVTLLSYGTIKGYDETAKPTKDINASDMAVNISYANLINKNFSAGVTLKYVTETLDDKTASTPSLDVGVIYKINKLSVGLSGQNLIGTMKFISEEEKIPMIARLGVAYNPIDKMLVLADVNSLDSGIGAGVGVEYTLIDLLALRVGYNYNSAVTGLGGMTGITAGIGINLKQFGLDVAYVPYGDLGNAIKAALSAKF